MRYITDLDGCVRQLSFGADIECDGQTCTEYTGKVPEGYASLEDWYFKEAEKLYRWKIVEGDLVLDSSAVETNPVAGKLTQAQKDALRALMDEWLNARGSFYYSGDILMDVYANDDPNCYSTTRNKYKLNCSTFVQFIMMGRHVADIAGKSPENYKSAINKAFDFGYYFQFKDRKYCYGVHTIDAETGEVDYYGFKNPLGDTETWKGSYSKNTYYAPGSTRAKKQVFNPFAYANDMARELYEMGCEIPFSELDVGDIVFTAGIAEDASESMFDNVAWRHITHVLMVYGVHSSGELRLVECTDTANTIITSHRASSAGGDRVHASNLLRHAVMCARLPIAFGIEPNVPDVITLSETPTT